MTQKIDIFIEQGTDWSYDFPIDEPVDLTGAAAAMQIRTINGATFIDTLTSANGMLIINTAARTITAKIAHGLTEEFVPGAYVYDMKVSDNANNYCRPVKGSAIVDPQVTVFPIPVPANNPITTEDGINITTEDGTKITT